MLRFLGYATGSVGFAVGSAFLIFVVWNQLIRAEIVGNATLEWYPMVAVVWGLLSIGVGVVLGYRARQAMPQQPSNH